jgi:Flp pilus assembly protein TadD
MKSIRSFKQKLAAIERLRDDGQFSRALAEVEELQESWPGNAHLHTLWAKLVQLQEETTHSLDEAKTALQHAVDLGPQSPAAATELGCFLDAVEDDPRAAARAFAEAVATARHLLIDGLLGRARALVQLEKKEEARRCLVEALYLANLDSAHTKANAEAAPDILLRDDDGQIRGFQLKGPFASRIEDLLKEILINRSA